MKPIIYAEIPDFDQETQAVFQTEPVDMGDHIYFGVEVRGLPPDEDEGGDFDLGMQSRIMFALAGDY